MLSSERAAPVGIIQVRAKGVPARATTTIMNKSKRIDTSVNILKLILIAVTFTVPGMTLTDRVAAAHDEPIAATSAAVPAVESTVEVSNDLGSAFAADSWEPDALGDIDPTVFAMALHAVQTAVARGDTQDPGTLTVIDFSRPSTKRRLWVYDLRSRTLLFEELVSHGRGSGRTMATTFSNTPDSHQSSLGLYRMAETYIGKHGYSLRLDGLERGINDRARERAIVMHGARYVDARAAKAQGFLGRSLGCPALRPEITRPLVEAVKEGGLLFAYYPDPQWLKTSEYLS